MSDTFRCSTGIRTDLPWQTEGPPGGGAASWLAPEVMGRNDALNHPGFVGLKNLDL